VGWASRPSFLDGRDAHPTITIKIVSYLIRDPNLDVGLNHFYTDSAAATVPNPPDLRKSEKALKQLQKRVSRKKTGSSNRKKAINKLGIKHLKINR
jgi:hypothetical protein